MHTDIDFFFKSKFKTVHENAHSKRMDFLDSVWIYSGIGSRNLSHGQKAIMSSVWSTSHDTNTLQLLLICFAIEQIKYNL